MWSKLLPIYVQSQIYGQILYDQTLKYMVKRKLWSNVYISFEFAFHHVFEVLNAPIVKYAANIW